MKIHIVLLGVVMCVSAIMVVEARPSPTDNKNNNKPVVPNASYQTEALDKATTSTTDFHDRNKNKSTIINNLDVNTDITAESTETGSADVDTEIDSISLNDESVEIRDTETERIAENIDITDTNLADDSDEFDDIVIGNVLRRLARADAVNDKNSKVEAMKKGDTLYGEVIDNGVDEYDEIEDDDETDDGDDGDYDDEEEDEEGDDDSEYEDDEDNEDEEDGDDDDKDDDDDDDDDDKGEEEDDDDDDDDDYDDGDYYYAY